MCSHAKTIEQLNQVWFISWLLILSFDLIKCAKNIHFLVSFDTTKQIIDESIKSLEWVSKICR